MACAAALKVPLTLTLSLGEPPFWEARAISTSSPEEVKFTCSLAIAVLLENLSAWPLEYKVASVTTLVPVGLTSKVSPSTRVAATTSAASTTLNG
jgi:hypothetical protein